MRVVILNEHKIFFEFLVRQREKTLSTNPSTPKVIRPRRIRKSNYFSTGGPHIPVIGTASLVNTGKIHFFDSRGELRETHERQGKEHESTCIQQNIHHLRVHSGGMDQKARTPTSNREILKISSFSA